MVLRTLREPGTGRPSPLSQLVAVLVVVGLVGVTAPVVLPVLRWLLSLF